MGKDKPLGEEDALRLLKDKGYIVKRPAAYRKRTFEVDVEIYEEFRAILQTKRMKIKEAFNLALRDWITKNKDET